MHMPCRHTTLPLSPALVIRDASSIRPVALKSCRSSIRAVVVTGSYSKLGRHGRKNFTPPRAKKSKLVTAMAGKTPPPRGEEKLYLLQQFRSQSLVVATLEWLRQEIRQLLRARNELHLDRSLLDFVVDEGVAQIDVS